MFLRALNDAQDRIPLRLLCYVLMPNHWHLVVWPARDDELARFMAWLTSTHSRRWHLRRQSVGSGTNYQGRYKAIAVKDDPHYLVVCRYVERNPIKAGLVASAADWPWSSASVTAGSTQPRTTEWPVARPEPWGEYVDRDESPGEFERLQTAIRSGTPYGPHGWREDAATRLRWPSGLRSRGRPRIG
jgi:putative transposase